MAETENEVRTYDEEFEALLPDGWAEGADIFDPDSWGAEPAEDAQEDNGDEAAGEEQEPADSTTTADDDAALTEENEGNGDTTTAAQTTGSDKLRFKATVDHEDKDIELDISELPTLYQKAAVMDRYQQKVAELTPVKDQLDALQQKYSGMEEELSAWDAIAKGLDFEDRTALRNGVIENAVQNYISEHPNVPEEMARDFITRKFNYVPQAKAPEAKPDQPAPAAQKRDFRKEVTALFEAFPDARGQQLPESVLQSAVAGKPLAQAYAEYVAGKAKADAATVKHENKILRQNQESAKRAPGLGVTGGGKTDTSPEDDFLRGFNSDSW